MPSHSEEQRRVSTNDEAPLHWIVTFAISVAVGLLVGNEKGMAEGVVAGLAAVATLTMILALNGRRGN